MLIRPLIRVPVPDSETAELVEPSAGIASGFLNVLRSLPQEKDDHVQVKYFHGLKMLVCLYDHGKPFLSQYINSLHAQNPEAFPVEVQEDVSISQTLEDVGGEYLTKVIDAFMNSLPMTMNEDITTLIREQVWKDRQPKN